jgi:hypothetical protein
MVFVMVGVNIPQRLMVEGLVVSLWHVGRAQPLGGRAYWKEVSSWGHVFGGHVEAPVNFLFLSSFLSHHKVKTSPPTALTMMYCCHWPKAIEPSNHGLKPLKL